MTPKRIKSFDQFSTDSIKESDVFESVYAEWKNSLNLDFNTLSESLLSEDYEDPDDRDLTSGEKAALARDFQILSKAQMAALYLRALGIAEDDDAGKYTIMIPGIKNFGDYSDDRIFNITVPAFADAIGLESDRTVSRTTRKFVRLITGEGETHSEAIYPKIVKYFEEFQDKNPTTLANLAGTAIQDTSYNKNREKAEQAAGKASAERRRREEDALKIGGEVYGLVKALKKTPVFSQGSRAQKTAIARLAKDYNLDPLKIDRAYQKYLSSMNISNFYEK